MSNTLYGGQATVKGRQVANATTCATCGYAVPVTGHDSTPCDGTPTITAADLLAVFGTITQTEPTAAYAAVSHMAVEMGGDHTPPTPAEIAANLRFIAHEIEEAAELAENPLRPFEVRWFYPGFTTVFAHDEDDARWRFSKLDAGAIIRGAVEALDDNLDIDGVDEITDPAVIATLEPTNALCACASCEAEGKGAFAQG